MTRAYDYPFGLSSRALAAYIADIRDNYGRSADSTMLRFLAPDLSHDEHLKRWVLRYHRLSMPPGVMLANWEGTGDVDLRPLLASIRVPTLVLEHEEPPFRSRPGRLVADTIASADYCEAPGRNSALWAPQAEWLFDKIESFITGAAPSGTTESDRFLTTLLFTDIVDSTRLASELGDQAWRERLDLHDTTIQSLIEQYRGTMVNHTGDGALANFDGPARAVRCGYALRDRLSAIGLRTRMGVHTGEVERRGESLSGVGVHLAARLLSICGPGELLVTRTVKDLVTGSGIIFEDRGVHAFKGLEDHWQVFSVSKA
jgi:class 3 adenylate cyclase